VGDAELGFLVITIGDPEGSGVGVLLGFPVGLLIGLLVGLLVGLFDGFVVGTRVLVRKNRNRVNNKGRKTISK
jgi:hypothetical protein